MCGIFFRNSKASQDFETTFAFTLVNVRSFAISAT